MKYLLTLYASPDASTWVCAAVDLSDDTPKGTAAFTLDVLTLARRGSVGGVLRKISPGNTSASVSVMRGRQSDRFPR